MLIIFSGLPGVGKTSLGRALATRLRATMVRVDGIEHALAQGGVSPIDGLGYEIAYAVALENLKLGRTVIADTVNPWELTRQAWRDVAVQAGVPSLDVEVCCSDVEEHRRRVESRVADLAGFKLPTWDEVVGRDYHAWTTPRLVVDLASLSLDEAVEAVVSGMLGGNGTAKTY
ncbi:MAG: ATP-binding protein [Methanoregulaceae archaeon]|nr:ATP-binding protein [Methanoregulaceae archaeon]